MERKYLRLEKDQEVVIINDSEKEKSAIVIKNENNALKLSNSSYPSKSNMSIVNIDFSVLIDFVLLKQIESNHNNSSNLGQNENEKLLEEFLDYYYKILYGKNYVGNTEILNVEFQCVTNFVC